MITIHLHNLLFYAYHGMHDEERKLGNDYELSAEIQFNETSDIIHSIHETINYADVYNLISQRMNEPSQLLETIVMEIGTSIKLKYDNVKSVRIHLKKIHPPISGIQGSVGVSWQKQF